MKRTDLTITLRALEPEDIDILYEWENNRSIWYVSNTLAPFSRYILTKYIENSHLDIYQTKQLRLMIDVGKEGTRKTIGTIDLFDFDPFHMRAGVGILITNEKDRDKGLATMALKELITYVFDVLQLHQLYCNVAPDNTASLKLFEKAGFTISGTKKDWLRTSEGYKDELLLQLIQE